MKKLLLSLMLLLAAGSAVACTPAYNTPNCFGGYCENHGYGTCNHDSGTGNFSCQC